MFDVFIDIQHPIWRCTQHTLRMVEGTTTVTVSVISGGHIAECEMDALLLGRTKVSLWFVYTSLLSLCV